MNSIDAGMSAGMVTMVAPTLSVQAQRDFKLTYQRSMNSWRMGLSFESCKRVRACLPTGDVQETRADFFFSETRLRYRNDPACH